MGRRGRERVLELYTLKKPIEPFEGFYRALL